MGINWHRQTTDHRPQTTDHRPQTTDHRPQTTDHRPQTGGSLIKLAIFFLCLNDFFMHEWCWYMCPHVTPKFFWKKSIRCVLCGVFCVFRLGTDPFLVTFESLVAHSLDIFIVKLVCFTVQTCFTLLSIPSKLLPWLVLDSTWFVIASLLLLS